MGTQQFCLKWNNHQTNMLAVFDQLLSSEALVDVTLACEGLSLKAHKMVLSACSPFFQSLFLENPCKHPIVVLKDMKYTDLKAIVDFMYRGEVNVSQDQLSALLKTAETLKVKGLAEVTGEQQRGASGVIQQEVIQQALVNQTLPASGAQQQHRAESPPLSRRKRGRPRRRSLSDSNRSDTEEVPSKIKEPDSPEVVEELSRDGPNDTNEVRQRLSSNHPQTQVAISHSNVLPSVTQKSITLPSVQDSVTVEEPQSGEDTEFEMEPSKLMEQTMTTDNVSVFSDSPSQGPTLTPVSNQLPIPTTVGLVDTPHHTPGPCGDSQSLVPCSMASEASTSSHLSQDTQDIKPGALVSFEEPPISPVAGPSHQDSSSMMMMYDASGVPAIPGPSNYQLDKQQNQPQQPQPQGTEDACLWNILPETSNHQRAEDEHPNRFEGPGFLTSKCDAVIKSNYAESFRPPNSQILPYTHIRYGKKGRYPKLSSRQQFLIVNYVLQHSDATLRDVQKMILENSDTFEQVSSISVSTIHRILKKHGLAFRCQN